jgi:GT2 family glycosyltransferase
MEIEKQPPAFAVPSSGKKLPKVSIIILNYKLAQDTIECVESIGASGYPNCEIIAVDNNSGDGSAKIIREKCPSVAVIENAANGGFGEGNNIGIRKALEGRPDYILLINNDTVVDKGFLNLLVDKMESEKNVGIAGPVICYYPQKDIVWSAGGSGGLWRSQNRCSGRKLKDCNLNAEVDYIPACCALVRADILARTGMFNPDYFLYSEDVDLSVRIKKAGYKLSLVPEAVIYHKSSLSTGGKTSAISRYYATRNRFLILKLHGGMLDKAVFYCAVLPLVTVKNVFVLDANSLSAFFQGMKDGFYGRFGKNPKLTP